MEKQTKTIVLYPAPGISHIMSMVELGKLLLHHHPNSFSISIFLTTGILHNASVDSYINRISQSYPSISFLRFPHLTVDSHPPRSTAAMHFEFIRLNATHVASALANLSQTLKIEAFVIDMFCTSALSIASSLGIPVFFFFTSGAAALSAFSFFPQIHEQINQSLKDLSIQLHFPGIPPLMCYHMPEPLLDRDDPAFWDFIYFLTHLPKSDGIIVNTFQELEPLAIKGITEGVCFPNPKSAPPVFYIGPLIAAESNDRIREEETECLSWLDKQPRGSVVYLCFGSRGAFSVSQLKEIAVALERSDQRFLWVVKKPPIDETAKQTFDGVTDFDLNLVLPSGFMEKTKEKGMVMKSWAPQVKVLSKESVGGFVTHCGWNSVLEAVVAGVPMIAWPLFAEQHINRNELVEDMKMAIGLEHRKEDGFVSGEELEKKVMELMESEKGREIRERSLKMKEMAASVIAPNGSSTRDLNELVERWNPQ